MAELTTARHPSVKKAALLLGLLLLVALGFFPGLSGGFIFDDYGIFAENPVVHIQGWNWQDWHRLFAWSLANVQRPLAMATYALDYAFGGGYALFKATNLAFHLLNVLLVWKFTSRLLGFLARKTPTACGLSRSSWLPIAIAAAWALHPLQVSAVLYVVQRMELMGFSFVLLALLAYLNGREAQMRGAMAWPWFALAAALTGVGYLAKETAVLIPAYAWLLEITVLDFASGSDAARRRWKLFYLAGATLAAAGALLYVFPHFGGPASFTGRNFDATERELTQLRVLALYLYWALLPLPSHLHFYYDNYPVSTGLLHPATTLFSGLLLVGLIGSAVWLRRRRPLFALGIGWFFIAHAITSSPISLELVFEHRNYPALLGLVLAAADLLVALASRMGPLVPASAGILLVVNFTGLTAVRAATWGNPVQLSLTLTQDNPGSARASMDLARRLMNLGDRNPDSPMFWMSIRELERGAALPVASILPDEALILAAADHPGRFKASEVDAWWSRLQHKVATAPLTSEYFLALHRLVEERVGGNALIDAHALARAMETVVSRRPSRFASREEYAQLAALGLHDQATAIRQWREAVDLHRDPAHYAAQLAGYLVDNHRDAEALAVLDEAAARAPANRSDPRLQALRARAVQPDGGQPAAAAGGAGR